MTDEGCNWDLICIEDNQVISRESCSDERVTITGYNSGGGCIMICSEPMEKEDDVLEIRRLIQTRVRAAYRAAKCYIKFEYWELSTEQEKALIDYAKYWGYEISYRDSILMIW